MLAKFNGVPIVQAANEAPLKVYYPDGHIEQPKIVEREPLWSIGRIEL